MPYVLVTSPLTLANGGRAGAIIEDAVVFFGMLLTMKSLTARGEDTFEWRYAYYPMCCHAQTYTRRSLLLDIALCP